MQESGTQTLPECVLVLIIRSVSPNVKFLLAHFATTGVTSDQIFCILWEKIKILEKDVDLDDLYITSDGASPKRRFIKLHQCYNAMRPVFSSIHYYKQITINSKI